MTETTSIRPPAYAQPSATGPAQVAPATGAQALQLNLAELPVHSAPPAWASSGTSSVIEGRVISSNPQAQEIRIQTAMGEVVLKSDAALPPDTKVSIRLYREGARPLAQVTILRPMAAAASPALAETSAALLPPLQAGQNLLALLLPAAMTPTQAGQASEPLKKALAQKGSAPSSPAAPPEEEAAPAAPAPSRPTRATGTPGAPSAPASLTPLPAAAPAPDLVQKMISAYFPGAPGGAEMPVTPISATADPLENSLLHLARVPPQPQASSPPAPESRPLPKNMADPLRPVPAAPALPEAARPGESLLLLNREETPTPPSAPAAPKAPPQAAPPPPQNNYQLTILKVLPPQTPPEQVRAAVQELTETSPPGLPPPQPAEVEAVTPGGSLILKTSDSRFILRVPASAPPGSTVIFAAAPLTAEQAAVPAPAVSPRPAQDFDPAFSGSWPALHEALQVIQQADPAVAQVLQRSLPAPAAARLAPTALFFLAALRLGAIENWMGSQALHALRISGRQDLIERLAGDFRKISTQSKEITIDDWRQISLPLLHDDQLSQMQFYVRQQPDHSPRGPAGGLKPVTRFILNLHLSRMGDMQLDGLARKKNLDLVLRTEDSLSLGVRQEIMQCFAQGLQQVNMQGGISFQTRRESWVTMMTPQHQGTLV